MSQLENVILAAFRSFAFLHSQGQKRTAIATCPTPSKITFAQMRAAGVRGVLVYRQPFDEPRRRSMGG